MQLKEIDQVLAQMQTANPMMLHMHFDMEPYHEETFDDPKAVISDHLDENVPLNTLPLINYKSWCYPIFASSIIIFKINSHGKG